jgi:hypothetical protein
MTEIYIYTVQGCRVDAEDVPIISKYRWKFNKGAYPYIWKKRKDGVRYKYYMHWMIMSLHKVIVPTGMEVDHIDRDRHNNSFSNLRIVTHEVNLMNRRRPLTTEEEKRHDRMMIYMRKDGWTEEQIKKYFDEMKVSI